MVDEAFHLTPLDVRRYDFGSALRGYDKARVEQFRDQIAEELERLARVNLELEGKAKSFHEQLRAFRDRDKALNEALVSAQQLRGEIREQADREGQLILREARAEADRMLTDAQTEIRKLEFQVEALHRTRRSHLAQLRALAQRQLADIDAVEHVIPLETVTHAQDAAPVSPAPPANASPDASEPAVRTKTPNWLDTSVPE